MSSLYKMTQEENEQLEEWKKVSSRYPVLKSDKQLEMSIEYKAGNRRAGEKLLYHNIKLVISIAKKHMGKGLPVGDLIQEGAMGFMKGLEKFDPTRGYKVSTYTTWWVRQAITRAIENKSRLVRVPSHKQQATNKVKWAYRQLLERRSDEEFPEEWDKGSPTARDLASMVNMTPEEVAECGRFLRDHISLSQLVNDDENTTLEDYIGADIESQPEEHIEHKADLDLIEAAIGTLDPEEQAFVRYKFGWTDGASRTSRQMSQLTQKPPSWNQKKEEEILAKLRDRLDLSLFNGFRLAEQDGSD